MQTIRWYAPADETYHEDEKKDSSHPAILPPPQTAGKQGEFTAAGGISRKVHLKLSEKASEFVFFD